MFTIGPECDQPRPGDWIHWITRITPLVPLPSPEYTLTRGPARAQNIDTKLALTALTNISYLYQVNQEEELNFEERLPFLSKIQNIL